MRTFSRFLRTSPACLGLLLALTACLKPPPPGSPEASSAGTGATNSSSQSTTAVPSVPYTWKSVVVMGGGFVTGIIFSPAKAGILYARTDIGGAYRYDPKDRSWIPLTDMFGKADSNYMGIESIAADPVKPDRVYMAVGMYTASWAGPGAFLKSDDRGDHWKVIPMPMLKMGGNDLGRSDGERLAIDPHQPSTLYFGSRRSGLWKSVDEAETWTKVTGFPLADDPNGLGLPFVVFDPRSGKKGEATQVIYVGASRKDGGLFRSTDGGNTWKPLPKQPTGLVPARAVLDKNGVLFVSYGLGDSPYAIQDGAVYRFDPKGDTWTDITPLKPSEGDKFGYGGITLDAAHPGTLMVSTMDRWSKGAEVFRSTDGGKTWKPIMAKAQLESGGAPHISHHRKKIDAPQWAGDLQIDPFDPNRAMIIDGGGIFLTENLTEADADKPTKWVFHTKNLEETAVREIISPPVGAPLLSAMADICGFRHDDLNVSPQQGNFENPTCASGDSIAFAGMKPLVVARVGTYPWDGKKLPRGGVSSDGGTTWKPFGSEPTGSSGSGTVVVNADGTVVVWAARDAIPAYSTDGGATWTTSAGFPAPQKVPDWAPWYLRLAADRVNAKKVYALDALQGQVYVSEDAGAHFKATSSDPPKLPEYNLIAASIQAVPGIEGDVWVTSGKQILHSTDSAKSFSSLPVAEESYGLGFGKAAPGAKYPAIYLSGKINGVTGFFRSDDVAESFVRVNDDAHQYGGSTIITGDPRVYGRVYIAPGGRGIVYGEPAK